MGTGATAAQEISRGERFEFGKNWTRFAAGVDERHIKAAEASVQRLLGVGRLDGKRFLDIGSGSGLFSLAAARLGATVHSFDYDPDSVSCTRSLQTRLEEASGRWTVDEGSVLDRRYLESLGSFDVVYSWGVLHHTGAMWTALEHAALPVTPGGQLVVAIYNDQGGQSRRWRAIKRIYCSGPVGKWMIGGMVIPWFASRRFLIDCLKGQNPLAYYTGYKARRGMSKLHDWHDWLGGYPFEVAKPEEVFRFFRDRGFVLTEMTTKGAAAGCNEFVFRRQEAGA